MSRRPVLPNSPLVDVSCEWRFYGELSLLNSVGAFQSAVRDDFPLLLLPGAVAGTSPLLQPLRMGSHDGSELIDVSVSSFSYHQQKYVDYEPFRCRVEVLTRAFTAAAGAVRPSRFGLRYQNLLPPAFEQTHESGNLHPCLRQAVSGMPAAASDQPELVFQWSPAEGLDLRMALIQPNTQAPAAAAGLPGVHRGVRATHLVPGVQLDFDCYRMHPPDSNFLGFVDAAHEAIDRTFFDSVTSKYLAYLEGRAP